VYFAPGAVHAPHHVPKQWISRWRGKFDQGWDVLREQILVRQIQRGVVPRGTRLAPKPDFIPDWASLSADQKLLFSRQFEVFAALLYHQPFCYLIYLLPSSALSCLFPFFSVWPPSPVTEPMLD
jgi:arylsulfatase A-like enzyme